ncbi:MAG: YodC family protein [Muribaculaceae bacterium]|nr:YodC family protein [Muribaculaceae bacterium]
MDELKIGDIVYLKSEDRIEMTVVWIDDYKTYANCAYFNSHTHTFEKVEFPINALSKVE